MNGTSTTAPAPARAARVRPAGYSVVKAGPRGRFLLHRRATGAVGLLLPERSVT
ncbi:hypothetical protein SGRI78S_04545 [Streptomyces griseus subsp. griseus]